MQAAILRVKLPLLDQWNEQRRSIASRYCAAFSNLPVKLPASLGDDFVAHLFVMRVENREAFTAYLKEHGVSTDVHYPIPDHWQTAYKPRETFNLPVTESACTQLVSLPCFPGLTDQQVDRVIEVVGDYFKQEV